MERVKDKRKSHVGEKYGHLLITEMIYGVSRTPGGRKRTKCKCVCDCGNEVVKDLDHIRKTGEHASCGCMSQTYRSQGSMTDETGNKYGRLTILGIDRTVKPTVAICRCDCGEIVKAAKAQVVYGKIQSCGCLQKDMASFASTKDFTGMVSDSGVRLIRRAYKERGVWQWECKCPICGNTFVALPAKVLSNHTTSCGCILKSSGERIIEKYLSEHNISYISQYRFNDCKDKYTLPFDFAVLDDKGKPFALIEYDGQQHFKPIPMFGGEEGYKCQVKRDKIKDQYCKENNLPLIRFTYKNSSDDIKNKLQTLFIRNDCNVS